MAYGFGSGAFGGGYGSSGGFRLRPPTTQPSGSFSELQRQFFQDTPDAGFAYWLQGTADRQGPSGFYNFASSLLPQEYKNYQAKAAQEPTLQWTDYLRSLDLDGMYRLSLQDERPSVRPTRFFGRLYR